MANHSSSYQSGYQSGGYTSGSHIVGGTNTYTTTQYQPATTTYTTSNYQPAGYNTSVSAHGQQEAQIVNTVVNTGK